MCERIYFTVDVSGTSNLFSRFVQPWLVCQDDVLFFDEAAPLLPHNFWMFCTLKVDSTSWWLL